MTSLSRLEKLGTIFTRVRDLMRAGVMKETDKPLWYDVMATFPPKHEPTAKQAVSPDPVTELLYPEDVQRAKFYKTYVNPQTIDLFNHDAVQKSICHRYIEKYRELESISHDLTEAELMVATEEALAEAGVHLRRKGVPRKQHDKEAQTQNIKPETKGLADLLKEALMKEDEKKS